MLQSCKIRVTQGTQFLPDFAGPPVVDQLQLKIEPINIPGRNRTQQFHDGIILVDDRDNMGLSCARVVQRQDRRAI